MTRPSLALILRTGPSAVGGYSASSFRHGCGPVSVWVCVPTGLFKARFSPLSLRRVMICRCGFCRRLFSALCPCIPACCYLCRRARRPKRRVVVEVRTVDPALYTVPPEANQGPREDRTDRGDPSEAREPIAPLENSATFTAEPKEEDKPRRRWDQNRKPAWTQQRPGKGVT